MKRIFYLFILASFTGSAVAQELKGSVSTVNEKGAKEPLPGANVYWQGTTVGTVTDAGGTFSIALPQTFPSGLIVSMVGFAADTLIVASADVPLPAITLKSSITLGTVNIVEKQGSSMYSTVRPIGTELISGKELLKAACCNLSESFSTNASVDVAFTDAVSGARKIQMLGLDGVYTQILSENMPALRGLSSAYSLTYIPGTWIGSMMVTKGSGSVVNGYESISGQINLELLKPEEQKERFFINLYGNLNGRVEANVHAAKKLDEKWSTLLLTHASSGLLKQDMNKDGFLDMPLTRQYNVLNRWNYHNGKNFEAQLGVKGLYDDRQGGQSNFDPAKDKGTTRAYGIGVTTRQVGYFTKTGFLFPSTPYKSIGLQTSGTWTQQDMYFGLRNYAGVQKNLYANLIYANIIGTTDHKYKLGASYLLDDYNERFNDSAFARTESVPGVFAEYTYTHAERFSLVAGLRADYHNRYGFFLTPRLHLRYNVTKATTLRLSGGRGFRTANVFAENQSVFASSRKVIVAEKLRPEIAWNYGVSANQSFKLFGNPAFVNVDFFRTDFQNQVIVDLDQDVHKVVFYNLDGKSYSHSLQVDLGMEPLEDLSVKLAYKWYDVKTTYDHRLLDKPYGPQHRVMLNLAYTTYMEIWKFDITANWFGSGRIPDTQGSRTEYRQPSRSPAYFLVQAQITKKFRKFELYTGCENILNFTQHDPVIAAADPFGPDFDASMVYAPVEGRVIYFGMRMKIK